VILFDRSVVVVSVDSVVVIVQYQYCRNVK